MVSSARSLDACCPISHLCDAALHDKKVRVVHVELHLKSTDSRCMIDGFASCGGGQRSGPSPFALFQCKALQQV
eukprot:6190792-Pleurochrysis_carterae.AAC.1